MRYVLVWLACVAANGLTHGQDFPLQVSVGNGGGLAYAGPDASQYATSTLAPGQMVDVYRLDPGGWCAIRPPIDSFCLVDASAIEVMNDQKTIGRLIRPDEKCWVGTMLGEVEEPMWQVRLKQGELVRLLGSIPSANSSDLAGGWFQIEPPSGEFRWVQLAELDDAAQSMVVAVSEGATYADGDIALASAAQDELFEPQVDFQEQRIGDAFFGDEDLEIELAPSNDNRGRWRPARRNPVIRRTRLETNGAPSSVAMSLSPPSLSNHHSFPSGSVAPWPSQLQQIDLQLSLEVLKQPAEWNLSALGQEILQFKQTANDPQHVAVADHLLNKISQFEQIRLGAQQIATTSTPPPATQSPAPAVIGFVGNSPVLDQRPPLELTPLNDMVAGAATFDAHGWLNELVRDGGMGQTTYVLQDDRGRITHHIVPSPGLNLHRYLKSRIGVMGQKGFNQKLNLDHVTAERIVQLDTVTR